MFRSPLLALVFGAMFLALPCRNRGQEKGGEQAAALKDLQDEWVKTQQVGKDGAIVKTIITLTFPATADRLRIRVDRTTVRKGGVSERLAGDHTFTFAKVDVQDRTRVLELRHPKPKGLPFSVSVTLEADRLVVAGKTPALGNGGVLEELPLTGEYERMWKKKTHTEANGEQIVYRLFVPLARDPKKAYPLVVWLHGHGEGGSDNVQQLRFGVTKFAAPEIQEKYPCFIVAPQRPATKTHSYWNPTVMGSGLVMGVIEDVEKGNRVDSKRIYVSGWSDGGYGVFALLNKHPDRFAAGVPFSGAYDPSAAPRFAHVPIWIFCGDKEAGVVRPMVEALEKAGGRPKFTVDPNAGHKTWGPALQNPKLFEWLFAQRVGDKGNR